MKKMGRINKFLNLISNLKLIIKAYDITWFLVK